MTKLFMLCLVFGCIALYLGVKRIQLEALDKRFLGTRYIKRSKSKNIASNEDIIVDTPKDKFLYFIRNIYTADKKINRKWALILLGIMVAILFVNSIFLQLNVLIVLIASFFLGVYIVNVLKAREIQNDYDKNFPEVLVILNGAISAGSNVTQALTDCSNSVQGVLRSELKTIVKSLSIGEDPSRVFEASYKRLPFKSYYFFLTALSVSLNSGAKLKEILQRLSAASTKAKAIEKKKDAMTSEARMSSKITAAIPFVFLFLMKFISPENFDFIMHDERGRYILYYFLGSELIGVLIIMFLMRKI